MFKHKLLLLFWCPLVYFPVSLFHCRCPEKNYIFFTFKITFFSLCWSLLSLFVVSSSTLFSKRHSLPICSYSICSFFPKSPFSFIFCIIIGRLFSPLYLPSTELEFSHPITFGQSHVFVLYIVVHHLFKLRFLPVLWRVYCFIILK